MTTPRYRIGNDMTILWAINNKDGSPFDLSGKDVRLFITHRFGREEVRCSVVTLPDGTLNNVIRWDFSGDAQKVLGPYALTASIYTSNDLKLIKKDICEAFELVGVSCMECEEDGDAVINDGGDLILSSKLDIYRFGIPKIHIGPDGYWYIDNVNTGVSALGGDPGLVRNIYQIEHLEDEFAPDSKIDTFNAYTIASLAKRIKYLESDDYLQLKNMTDVLLTDDLKKGQSLVWDGTHWINKIVETKSPSIDESIEERLQAIEAYFAIDDPEDNVINKWNEIVAFLDGIGETTLGEILKTYAKIADLEKITPRKILFDLSEIVSFAGPINRQTREQLYNIFLFTEGNEVPSEPAWVIDTNGQHYIVRMLQTETGVGFFIIGYEGYTRIEGDNTKTNQLLRDKIDKEYVKDFLSQASFDPAKTHDYIIPKVESYTSVEDSVGAGGRSVNFSIDLRIKDDIGNAAEDDLDNGLFRNGLVTALGVKNWVESKGYLTSAAMNGYATKAEIKDFISKSGGTVTGDLRIQGNITLLGEALFRAETPSGGTYPRFRMFQHTNGLFFQAASYDGTSVKGKIGFTGYGGSPAEDIQFIADSIRFVGTASFNGVQLGELAFKNTADIMAVGGTIGSNSNFNDYTTPGSYLVAGENMQNAPGGYGTLLVIRGIEDYFHSQLFVNANGTVKVRTESDGVKNWQPWRTLIDDANIATQLQNVGDSRYLKLTGGKITGSLEISADESIKASIPAGGTYSRYRFIQNNSALYFQVCKYDGIDRAGVLIISGISGIPAEKIQLNAQTLLFSGAATFQNSITLGNNTITSWDDFITSDGGTINAGKYLKFATSAYPVSLGVAATLDGYDKLVVSGLTQMSDLYITEKLYFEKGCTVTFRNWSTGEKETISSFSDLKGVLGLGGLAYKDEADVVKSASDFAASGNPNVIGYSYERNGWKGNGPAMLWGTDGYYTRLNVLTEDTDSPQMFISNVYANNAKGWAKVITDKNIGSYGLELIVASTHPEPTDRRAFATYAYQSYGWKTTGPALAFPDGTSKGLIQMGYDTDFVRMYIAGVKTEGVLSWTEVVTQETIGSMAMSIRSERLDASVDADDIINPGSYIVIGSTSFPVSHGVALTVAGTNTYFIGQLVLDGSGHIYSRLRWGEDWSDWNTVIDEGNIGDYALPKAGGTISGSLAVTGALAANGGIKLGDETINSWAEVRSNWGWRYTSLINQVGTIQIDIKIRQKTTIAETLTSAHRLVFNLITEANTNPEWLIVFTTGTTVPIIGIAKGSDSLYWQNNQNILNNLSPHTTYRIYIDSNLVMYDTFNVL